MAHILTCMYFATPVVVAFTNGSTYTFAFSVSGVGVLLYFTNIFLIRRFISTRAPELLDDWEATAGTGVVPRWVSEIGLAGLAFIPSGIVVASLLLLGFVPHH